MIWIYTLSDPETFQIRYVGKTNNLKRRYATHTTSFHSKSHVVNWIKSLKSRGLKPIMEVLDEVDDNVWVIMEQYWIAQIKAWGFNLVNLTIGGEGVAGYGHPLSHEHIERLRKVHKGKVLSQEVRDKIARTLKGHHSSSETKMKQSLALRGRNLSEGIPRRCYYVVYIFDTANNYLGSFHDIDSIAAVIGEDRKAITPILKGTKKSAYKLYKIRGKGHNK